MLFLFVLVSCLHAIAKLPSLEVKAVLMISVKVSDDKQLKML